MNNNYFYKHRGPFGVPKREAEHSCEAGTEFAIIETKLGLKFLK
jgi:hypothetical protein